MDKNDIFISKNFHPIKKPVSIQIRNLTIEADDTSKLLESYYNFFIVWNKDDKYPSIKEYKTIKDGKFIDSKNNVWDYFARIPKCLYCINNRKNICRGNKYNVLCSLRNYKNYKGNKKDHKILPPKMTWKNLSKWLAQGNGEVLINNYISTSISYNINIENSEVDDKYLIRDWDGEWRLPYVFESTK